MKRLAGTTSDAYWRCDSCVFLKNGLFAASSAATLSRSSGTRPDVARGAQDAHAVLFLCSFSASAF